MSALLHGVRKWIVMKARLAHNKRVAVMSEKGRSLTCSSGNITWLFSSAKRYALAFRTCKTFEKHHKRG